MTTPMAQQMESAEPSARGAQCWKHDQPESKSGSTRERTAAAVCLVLAGHELIESTQQRNEGMQRHRERKREATSQRKNEDEMKPAWMMSWFAGEGWEEERG